ncbi:MAG: adenylyl-sulfate kinase [Bacteroidetes bacterium]|nr:adenylyl-sulfate kinase [Bacteroidota bacterium]MBK9523579.1 adenylyl-sulfate kinase [Bacteroidota bacterium]MBP6401916.1 adenylyl-sulfate kinase [Bacteroidia bacterium]MBP6649785.1 adenylyl-sulfate kinase [Bacteroidia bacterium]
MRKNRIRINQNQITLSIYQQEHKITKSERAKLLQQKPVIIWFTGLSGSGKSTLAGILEEALYASGYKTYLLDGDNVRFGLNKDLGFSEADRKENIRRVAEVAKLMMDAGLIVITAFISPYREDRDLVRKMVQPGEFVEVFVNTPLDVCEQRDPKGLYKKVRAGELQQFTGIDSPYEEPLQPELNIQTMNQTPEESVKQILEFLEVKGEG